MIHHEAREGHEELRYVTAEAPRMRREGLAE